ncbi:hypothetical protein Ciccas_005813 [Cichlidogyrus casuarinus]|uniref:Uncharacterized protein n=1 Tax=Cichlidogyrus casuarinus TaxID=1844966 RepID=A0ABD2Q7L9_9PLAT
MRSVEERGALVKQCEMLIASQHMGQRFKFLGLLPDSSLERQKRGLIPGFYPPEGGAPGMQRI